MFAVGAIAEVALDHHGLGHLEHRSASEVDEVSDARKRSARRARAEAATTVRLKRAACFINPGWR
jgi:hypothetical protein